MRLAVIGTSGSGKSTLASAVARKLGIKYIEQDNLFWLPGWQMVPKDRFAELLTQEIAGESWAICGNHSFLQEKIWSRATHLVWLNYPLRVSLTRGLRRTVQRVFLGQECCNGNYESFRHAFMSRDSILWWILKTHNKRRRQYRQVLLDGKFAHLNFLEFTRPIEADRWLKVLID